MITNINHPERCVECKYVSGEGLIYFLSLSVSSGQAAVPDALTVTVQSVLPRVTDALTSSQNEGLYMNNLALSVHSPNFYFLNHQLNYIMSKISKVVSFSSYSEWV